MSNRDLNEKPTCCDCRFWDHINDDIGGFCRRHAPRPTPEKLLMDRDGNVIRYVHFPLTAADDWCGELVEIEVTPPTSHCLTRSASE